MTCSRGSHHPEGRGSADEDVVHSDDEVIERTDLPPELVKDVEGREGPSINYLNINPINRNFATARSMD